MRFAESEATQGKTNEETVRKPFGTLLNVMGERETFYFLSVSQWAACLSQAIFMMLFVLELGMEFINVRKHYTFNDISKNLFSFIPAKSELKVKTNPSAPFFLSPSFSSLPAGIFQSFTEVNVSDFSLHFTMLSLTWCFYILAKLLSRQPFHKWVCFHYHCL